ncbi:hypothetical protein G9A89_022271 [Geosiphon pyriformis]|nr:hypothetical protein G9A89_022271 [Geosiphon pyriformis]
MEHGFNIGVKSAKSRKKRRSGALEDNIGNKKLAAAKAPSGCSWGSKTGNTTESDSVNMKEKFLVEKTSFDYRKDSILTGRDLEQTPKSSKILTKKALGKPLRKIDFLGNDSDNILLDKPVVLPPLLKNLVNVSVRKFFALDISLDNVVGKSAQEKLMVIRKLFSKINGFGGAFIPSKFARIIKATSTSELSLVQGSKKTKEAKILAVMLKEILIGTEAVHAVLAKFRLIKLIKMQLVGLWQKVVVEFKQSILIGKDAVRVTRFNMDKESWNVRDKTCVIDCHLVSYVQTKCTTVCFNFAESLDVVIKTMSVLKGANLCWSYLVLAKCTGCRKLGHTLLACPVDGKKKKTLLDSDKSRLAVIYAKCLAPVVHPVFFGDNILLKAGSSLEMKPTPLVSLELIDRFATFECSLTSLTEHVNMLAKRLNTPEPMISQLRADIVMSENLGVATGGETIAGVVVFDPTIILKIEKTLNSLLLTVMSLLAKMNNASSEKDILVSIFMESKLKGKIYLWIVNKFDGVWWQAPVYNSSQHQLVIAANTRELSQYTTKKVAVIAATIVKIHRKIEQYANENFPISTGNTRERANKTKENLETNQKSNQQKLGTPAQTPKKTVTQSIKKQRIYSPEDKSYHFSPENKIQIPLGAASSLTSTP